MKRGQGPEAGGSDAARPKPIRRRDRTGTHDGVLGDTAVWTAVQRVAEEVDRDLDENEAGLWMGSEPTFVSSRNRADPQWWSAPLGDEKLALGRSMARLLAERLADGALLMDAEGKRYDGEAAPRWACAAIWRRDRLPLWRTPELLVHPAAGSVADIPGPVSRADILRFGAALADALGVDRHNLSPCRVVTGGRTALLLPLARRTEAGRNRWHSEAWPATTVALAENDGADGADGGEGRGEPVGRHLPLASLARAGHALDRALCLEARGGVLRVFLPPVDRAEDFVELVNAIETVALALGLPVALEGHAPRPDPTLHRITVTPDPGVLEINTRPVRRWETLEDQWTCLWDAARTLGLDARRYLPNGQIVGTGGGCHILVGGAEPMRSPLHRRPDLARSILAYWHNHPALSYFFAGQHVGPHSQHVRIDEHRPDATYELEIALALLDRPGIRPDRALRHLAADAAGNAHRSGLCIDKLAPSPNGSGLGGLLELRGFQMQPTPRSGLVVQLLIRALIAWFWREPYRQPLRRWGARLHDEYMLPGVLWADLCAVLADLRRAGHALDAEWFLPHRDFQFPLLGTVSADGVQLDLRQALNPCWLLADYAPRQAGVRFVDNSSERIEVRLSGERADACAVLCNGYELPLHDAEDGGALAGLRFRAWPPVDGLHPDIAPEAALAFDIFDRERNRFLARCRYRPLAETGDEAPLFPADAAEAERRRRTRFTKLKPRKGRYAALRLPVTSETRATLDLRRAGLDVATAVKVRTPWPGDRTAAFAVRRRAAPDPAERTPRLRATITGSEERHQARRNREGS